MNLKITVPDPFNILTSTKTVIENAKFVNINQKRVEENAVRIAKFLKKSADFPDYGHRLVGDLEKDIQLIFFESMMGFCFWSFPGKVKWGIELSGGEKVDGWYGVCASFKRAYDEGVSILDADFLASISKKDVKNIFRSATGVQIPLLDERVSILNKNAQILKKHFKGQALNLINESNNDAVKLFKLLLKYFPSYRDTAVYNSHKVVFLKIAHLFALDLEYRLTPQSKRPFLKNLSQLCVFADYKLPQLLRMFGILEYKKSLADMVDSYTLIPKGSPQEIELRAGAIWGVDLLRQQIRQYSSIQVGHVIWLMSQDQTLQARIKPYHRTYTTYY